MVLFSLISFFNTSGLVSRLSQSANCRRNRRAWYWQQPRTKRAHASAHKMSPAATKWLIGPHQRGAITEHGEHKQLLPGLFHVPSNRLQEAGVFTTNTGPCPENKDSLKPKHFILVWLQLTIFFTVDQSVDCFLKSPLIFWVCKMSENGVKCCRQCLPKAKLTFPNVLSCPQPKDILFNVTEKERNQEIYTFKKLPSENFSWKPATFLAFKQCSGTLFSSENSLFVQLWKRLILLSYYYFINIVNIKRETICSNQN